MRIDKTTVFIFAFFTLLSFAGLTLKLEKADKRIESLTLERDALISILDSTCSSYCDYYPQEED